MGLRHLSVQSKMETPCRYLDHSGQLCRQYWRFSLKNPSSCLFFPSGLWSVSPVTAPLVKRIIQINAVKLFMVPGGFGRVSTFVLPLNSPFWRKA